jgi:hypothetical protein
MSEFQLTRDPGDRRLYVLASIGTIHLPKGWRSRGGRVEANGRTWEVALGRPRHVQHATDETGTIVGRFQPHILRRGGTLRWIDRELKLRPVTRWRWHPRYTLADGDHELAVFELRRRLKITVDTPTALDPGLLLFAAYLVLSGAADPV